MSEQNNNQNNQNENLNETPLETQKPQQEVITIDIGKHIAKL